MSLVVSWLLFPLVLGVLSLGCGLLLEFAAGQEIPRTLLLPLGFAAIVVVSLGTTASSETARLTTPAVVALAAAGLCLALPWRPRQGGGWAATTAVATYAALGAPVFLSGSATFAGYIALDDTATWLSFTDRLLEHGRNVTGLAPSTYQTTLNIDLIHNGYPAGAFSPLGVMHELLGVDSAWLVQPYVAFLGAMLALGLYGLTARIIESAPLRAFAAGVAAQPALLYGYSLWGGVKEEASAAILVLVAALTALALGQGVRMRSLLPLATAAAGLLGVLGVLGTVWIAPILIPALVVGLRLRGLAFTRATGAFVAFTLVLSIPTLLITGRFLTATGATSVVRSATGGASANGLAAQGDLGNLFHPLSDLQVFGIWPAGDFRLRPENIGLTYVLVAGVALAALAGSWWAWRRRDCGLLLYVLGAAIGCAASVAVGSPWIDAKALAIASPATLIAAMAAFAWLVRSGRRAEAAVAILAVAGGVFWSNVLAYHDVWLAPRSQLRELETIGKQFSGDGPALLTEYAPYGARHFLRHLDPEGASELRYRLVLLRNGQEVEKGGYADIDDFQLDGILVYRTLVLVHSPSASRPPSVYRLVWSGPYYDVWQRPEPMTTRILEHLPLGDGSQPGAVPACAEVLRLGRAAAASNGRVAAVVRPEVTVIDLSAAVLPPSWQVGGSPGAVYPSSPGTLQAAVSVPATGRYGIWLAGSFRPQIELSVDGRKLATAQNHLNHAGVDTPLGQTELAAGPHSVSLHYGGATLSPGSGGTPLAFGPLVLSRFTAESSPVTYLQPARAGSLCGKRLDWVEAVAG
jgi:hypothetical protein